MNRTPFIPAQAGIHLGPRVRGDERVIAHYIFVDAVYAGPAPLYKQRSGDNAWRLSSIAGN